VRYEHNGAVYVTSPYLVARGEIVGGLTGFYVMPPERSIDIDTQEDLDRAREIWERTHG
jgi:CMP-N-acetylneuraminic acid synthetase